MTETQMFYAQVGSILVATIMAVVSSRWRNAGRVLFVLLFLWAAQENLRTAVGRPEAYLEYAPLAYSELYRRFILGFFAQHITAMVSTIAIGQFLIAVCISWRGVVVQLGLVGAIVFFVAIAPLGTGSAFPATLIMALGAALLLRTQYQRTLWSMGASWLVAHRRNTVRTG
jgi:hypothetical protein